MSARSPVLSLRVRLRIETRVPMPCMIPAQFPDVVFESICNGSSDHGTPPRNA